MLKIIFHYLSTSLDYFLLKYLNLAFIHLILAHLTKIKKNLIIKSGDRLCAWASLLYLPSETFVLSCSARIN